MSRTDRWRPAPPEAAVFVSGITSMGLEILAGRMIAPQFGSSVFTWGSVIGVLLAALSAGYYIGGKRAAQRADVRRLVTLLIGAAAYVAVVIFAGDAIVRSTAVIPLPPRYSSLPAVIVLFGPPTYLLGFISPYAAELLEKNSVGEASGHVYAVGTVGSILGAFGTTFVLIPALGVETIAFLFGIVLLGTAAWLLQPTFPRRQTVTAVLVTLLLVGAVAAPSAGVTADGQVVHQTQTPYQELEVIDRGDTRTLFLGNQRHSAMDRTDPTRHVFEYTRYFHLPYLFAEDPETIDRALFVGGGGFSGPKAYLEHHDVHVDVVEVDPDVIDAAKTYFEVEPTEDMAIHNAEGRQFLTATDEEYDVIVLDAYKKDEVPFQLTTAEFMTVLEERLTPSGMVVANVISSPSGPASEFYRSQHKTMDQVFRHVYTFPTSDSPTVQNVMLVATKDDQQVPRDTLTVRAEDRAVGVDLGGALERYQAAPPATADVPTLRDDHAPVDQLLNPMLGQRYVVEEATNTTTAAPG